MGIVYIYICMCVCYVCLNTVIMHRCKKSVKKGMQFNPFAGIRMSLAL